MRSLVEAPVRAVRTLIDQRATEIEGRIAELQDLRADLARLAKRARLLDPGDCDPAAICHIIATPAG